jgi:hypothetical protein
MSDSGQYQTVVIDRGSRDGLEQGHVLAVYREGLAVKLTSSEDKNVTWVKEASAAPDGGAWLYSDVRCLKEDGKVTYDQVAEVNNSFRKTCLGSGSDDDVKLPDAQSGLVMLYRVYERVSYALIMQSSGPVYLLDRVQTP